ncbi:MAG: allophanate hydrolase, partial [Novosphingobium meiothermophilum]
MSAAFRQSASRIAADVGAGITSAVAVMEATLARIAAYDAVQPQVWISRASPDDLLAQARAVDARV